MGGAVCWIFFACDVACDNKMFVSREEVMDSPEDKVHLFVATPPFDNASVVTKEPKVLVRLTKLEDSMDQELEANCFSPQYPNQV